MATLAGRDDNRKELASLLEEALVGDGKPAQALYEYRAGDFESQSPVVVVTSHGSEYVKLTHQGFHRRDFFRIIVFTLYTDGADWNEDDCEDATDQINELIAEVLAMYKGHHTNDEGTVTYWKSLAPSGPSTITYVVIGTGEEYHMEDLTVIAEVY